MVEWWWWWCVWVVWGGYRQMGLGAKRSLGRAAVIRQKGPPEWGDGTLPPPSRSASSCIHGDPSHHPLTSPTRPPHGRMTVGPHTSQASTSTYTSQAKQKLTQVSLNSWDESLKYPVEITQYFPQCTARVGRTRWTRYINNLPSVCIVL